MRCRSIQFVSVLLSIGAFALPEMGRAIEPSNALSSTAPPANPVSLPAIPSPSAPALEPLTPQPPETPQPSEIVPVPQPAPPVSPTTRPSILNQPGAIIELEEEPKVQSLRLEIQLSRRRVVLYRGDAVVKSYPIAVGRPGWETPKGTFMVKQMFKDPTWIHPLKKGIVIPGGDPENPLGRYWIGFWSDGKNWIGFHGTPNPRSVGTAASHGCIRMYNKDIEELFKQVSLGTVVTVIQ